MRSSSSLGIVEELAGFAADVRVVEDSRVFAFELPRHEERRPVDVLAELFQRDVFEHARADELGLWNVDRLPIGLKSLGEGVGVRHELRLLPLAVRGDELLLQLAVFGIELAGATRG